MSIVEAVKSIMWARRHQPHDVVYGVALGHERFGPLELLDQAKEAERAGFDLVGCSDHLAPWWDPSDGPPAHCANAWVWLGAAGQATSTVSLGPAVSALVHRYNPVVMAQQAATLELMNPGRAFLGVGSGEAMNEVPAGLRWPAPAGQRVSDREFRMMGIVSADPATHVQKLKAMRALGATAVVIMNVSGADPIGTLKMYGEHVLPALRG